MITPDGRAIVLDFGIARAVDPAGDAAVTATRTAPGVVAGTPAAMSPEQARGEPLDARTDVFSFGTMLHRMLTGREPFAGPTPADSIAAVLTREAPPLPPGTSPELSRIVHKSLEKDRDLRYGSMREIVVDLERLRRGSTTAVAVAPKGRLRPAARRAAIAALVLAVAAVVAWAVWKPDREPGRSRRLPSCPSARSPRGRKRATSASASRTR
jgi:serine/threonine protein kinase